MTWLAELRVLAALSWPLALSNVAQVAMGATDVMMMGRLGPDTLAAGALGTNLYFIALIFGIGLLNAVTPMIARELGRGSPPALVDNDAGTVLTFAQWVKQNSNNPCVGSFSVQAD